MSRAPSHDHSRLRVDLFSDAVFAVAITLLVLNLPLSNVSGSLLTALADRWAAFVAFGISFVIIGCLWVSHFRLFRLIDEVDSVLLFLNLALLFTIVLLPFGASTIATFVTGPGTQSHLAASLFAGSLFLMGLAFSAVYMHVMRRTDQRRSTPPSRAARLVELRPLAGVFVNAAGVGVAFVSPIAVLVMTGAVAILYIVDQMLERPPGARDPEREPTVPAHDPAR